MMTLLRSNGKPEVNIAKPFDNELQERIPSSKKPSAKRIASSHSIHLNNSRRKIEDKMAKLFMWIVVVFITCHFPR